MLRNKRREAIRLRRSGKSYNEIKAILSVAKSSLAYWLKNYPLTTEQVSNLTKRYKDGQIENFRNTMRLKREKRLNTTYEVQKKNLLPLTQRELLIAGLFLYLGEGAKQTPGQIIVSNTDPNIIKFVLNWYTNILKIPKDKIKVNLQLYRDMDINKELSYWKNILHIPLTNFWKPYIKKSSTKDIDHSGYKHGTCGLYYGNVPLHENIMMGIKCMLDNI